MTMLLRLRLPMPPRADVAAAASAMPAAMLDMLPL